MLVGVDKNHDFCGEIIGGRSRGSGCVGSEKEKYMIQKIQNLCPKIGERCFVAETAAVVGDVTLGDECSIWYSAVLRGDVNYIRLGRQTNVQDCACLHVSDGEGFVEVGDRVTIGHNACVHGCRIGDDVLIGMGATVLDGVRIAGESVVAAGALVLSNTEIGPRELWGGVPARLIRRLTEEDVERIISSGNRHYVYWNGVYLDEPSR